MIYQIHIQNRTHFAEVIKSLFSIGYVYSKKRCKNIGEVIKDGSAFPWLRIGYDDECKMVLRSSFFKLFRDENHPHARPASTRALIVTIEEFLKIVADKGLDNI